MGASENRLVLNSSNAKVAIDWFPYEGNFGV